MKFVPQKLSYIYVYLRGTFIVELRVFQTFWQISCYGNCQISRGLISWFFNQPENPFQNYDVAFVTNCILHIFLNKYSHAQVPFFWLTIRFCQNLIIFYQIRFQAKGFQRKQCLIFWNSFTVCPCSMSTIILVLKNNLSLPVSL